MSRVTKLPKLLKELLKREIQAYPQWWRNLSIGQRVIPGASVLAYWGALRALHGFRGDHVTTGVVLLALSYGGRGARRILRFVFPLLLTGIIYDSQRFYSDYLRGPIHVVEPYRFDLRFFGISTPTGILTPNEWWQVHTVPALDILTGFFYLVFVFGYVAIAGWFHFEAAEAGPARNRPYAQSLTWGFLWLNLLGYSTYYWYAAAPPWYVALYGLGPARLDVPANQAGCIRFDQALGTHFFSEMYGRSADVFGAIPSLHIAYPLLAAYFAFRLRSLRLVCVGFYLVMCFSSVYLNHHYILDVLWGSVYAILIALVMEAWAARSRRLAAPR